jgi:GR25 family glycosyltransferase involved in LPS biosynthesis
VINNNYEIVEAQDWTKKIAPKSFRGPSNGGAYGCCISHLRCIDDATTNNYDTIMIMEDDLMFHKNFCEEWNSISIPNNWNILYLSASQLKWENINLDKNKKYYKAWKSLGGTAYILKKNMFQLIKKLFFQERKPIDELLIIVQNKFNCYVLYPNLCINYMNDSNIRKNNTWKIETTGKRFKWDIDLYDQSIILNNKIEPKTIKKTDKIEEQNNDYSYKINHIKVRPLSKTKQIKYLNAKAHYIILNNNCNLYVNNKWYKKLNKNDHICINPNTNLYFQNNDEQIVEILESIIYI